MTVLVTGGSGFLGTEICRRLAARGTPTRSLTRRPAEALAALGVRQYHGDLADPAAVSRAVAGCDAVIHTGALAGVSGRLGPYHATNVTGTRNVLDACRHHRVPFLVHTSTASVAFTLPGLVYADESAPVPERHAAAYPRTKAAAEALVTAGADRPGGPAAVVLRPHIVWGPGDPHFLPALLRVVRRGNLVMPGDGRHLLDTTHLHTAAQAHLLALDRLRAGAPLGGRVYFVAQGEPLPLRAFVTALLAAAGVRARWRTVPAPAARAAAALHDQAARLLRSTATHRLSRLLVDELTHPHWFDLTAARRDLGFRPETTVAEGMAALAAAHGGTRRR
ncbi:NAD-dependent epimerase/dehydratase family protein [Streptomyces sp. 6N223]|uniref:NAD-dependent epimerase/dehydratase family protein n=1 Tax=Streptomyces sp. 6N223 TaxID=3457412 RepID=UPI003FD45076